jgi:ABC-type antimicrobial peptide transport system permease subunit
MIRYNIKTSYSYLVRQKNISLWDLLGLSIGMSDVITSITAKKLYGDENPSGKELIIGDFSFTVDGILKDLPENSIFKFHLLGSHHILKKMYPDLAKMWWVFCLAGIIALATTLLTLSWQSWRASTRNPVDALRYE